MSKRIFLGSFLLFTLLLIGCNRIGNVNLIRGSGNVTSETRAVSGVTGVALEGVGQVEITQGTMEGLTVTAEDNFLPHLTSQVKDGVLVLGSDTGIASSLMPTKPIVYQLHVINLDSITVSGAGSISAPALKSDALKLTMSGAGEVNLPDVQANRISTAVSGTGNVTLAGKVTAQELTLSGLGNYGAANLASETANIVVSGAGKATVEVSKSLNVQITGAGSVGYYGNPQVTEKITGVGGVTRLGDKK